MDPNVCQEAFHHWWEYHLSVGIAAALLGVVGIVSPWAEDKWDNKKKRIRMISGFSIAIFLMAEIWSINRTEKWNDQDRDYKWCIEKKEFNAISTQASTSLTEIGGIVQSATDINSTTKKTLNLGWQNEILGFQNQERLLALLKAASESNLRLAGFNITITFGPHNRTVGSSAPLADVFQQINAREATADCKYPRACAGAEETRAFEQTLEVANSLYMGQGFETKVKLKFDRIVVNLSDDDCRGARKLVTKLPVPCFTGGVDGETNYSAPLTTERSILSDAPTPLRVRKTGAGPNQLGLDYTDYGDFSGELLTIHRFLGRDFEFRSLQMSVCSINGSPSPAEIANAKRLARDLPNRVTISLNEDLYEEGSDPSTDMRRSRGFSHRYTLLRAAGKRAESSCGVVGYVEEQKTSPTQP